jgi:hypothetical protein
VKCAIDLRRENKDSLIAVRTEDDKGNKQQQREQRLYIHFLLLERVLSILRLKHNVTTCPDFFGSVTPCARRMVDRQNHIGASITQCRRKRTIQSSGDRNGTNAPGCQVCRSKSGVCVRDKSDIAMELGVLGDNPNRTGVEGVNLSLEGCLQSVRDSRSRVGDKLASFGY